MRKLVIAFVVLLLLFGAVLGAAYLFVSTEDLRARLEREIAAATGRETRIEALDLALLPLPALRIQGVRIAGESALVKPFAEIDAVRLRLALWPLLRGEVALASLTLERPRLVVPLDKDGKPLLPRPAATSSGNGTSEAAVPAAGSGESAAVGALLVAIDAFHVREGSARIGRYGIESIDVDGALRSGGRAEVGGSFVLPETARVRDFDVEIEGIGAAEWSALASARVVDGDLEGVARMARLGKGYAGKFELDVDDLSVVNFAAKDGKIRGHLHDLAVQFPLTSVGGEADLTADAAGNWKLDLTETVIQYAAISKPAGTPFTLEGPFPDAPGQRLEARVVLPGNEIPFVADYARGDIPRATISPTTIAFEPLAQILAQPLGGRMKLGNTVLVLGPPPAIRGDARLEELSYPVAATTAFASGDVSFASDRIIGKSLRLRLADQPFDVAFTLGLGGPWIETTIQGSGLDVEALAVGLVESRDIAGKARLRTYVRGALKGEETVGGLDGNGRIEIAPGHIRGFSLVRQTFGELATLPIAVATLRGKDLSRYEDEEFESLTADYFILQGKLVTENLKLVYRNATAELAGDVNLADGALHLAGRLVLAPDLDRELGAASGAKPRVIPIAGIGGTVAKPRLRLDADAAVAIGAAFTGSDRIKEKLEKKLGPGAGDAVEGVLDLLRGGKKQDAGDTAP